MQSSIPEVSPTKENPPDSISEMCQQLTQGLSALTTQSPDPFASAPGGQSTTTAAVHSTTPPCAPPVAAPQTQPPSTGTGEANIHCIPTSYYCRDGLPAAFDVRRMLYLLAWQCTVV